MNSYINVYLRLFIFQYFAKTIETWTVYCISTAITLVTVKIINLLLHVMYDEAQIVSEGNSKKSDKGLQETNGYEFANIRNRCVILNVMLISLSL